MDERHLVIVFNDRVKLERNSNVFGNN